MALRRVVSSSAPRGVAAVATTTSAIAATQTRGIYSIWGTVCNEGNSLQPTSTGLVDFFIPRTNVKSFQLEHAPEKQLPGVNLSVAQSYLLSMIENDIERLTAVDWTVEFDSFWADAVVSHRRLFEQLYNNKGNAITNAVLGNFSGEQNASVKAETLRRLCYLESCLKWAEGTERVFTALHNERFTMQREIFNSFEREKVLAGCIEAVDSFIATVPSEFKRKATQDIEWHLNNVRHWVWDAPNTKMQFRRRMASTMVA